MVCLAIGVCMLASPADQHGHADPPQTSQTNSADRQPDSAPNNASATRQIIQQGRRLESRDPVAAADQFVAAATRHDVPAALIKPLRFRAAGLYFRADRLDAASAELVILCGEMPDQDVVDLTLSVASKWFEKSDLAAAERLFRVALETDYRQQDANLGLNWIACQRDDPPWDACQRLLDFADENPDHPAADRSRQLAAGRLGVAIEQYVSSDGELDSNFQSAFENWRAVDGNANVLTAWLHRIEPERAADLARVVLYREPVHQVDRCGQAAARWAGRSDRWSILEALSRRVSVDELLPKSSLPENSSPENLSPGAISDGQGDLARLIAESLVQSGRPAASLAWWQRLVETRFGGTFAVKLRLAEVETAIGDDSAAAKSSIDAARVAVDRADTDAAEKYLLVDMLEANWSIRRADFENARYLLEQIVRRPHRSPAVAANAQWLIGETFSMQGKYADAIEAYRKVDGIDPSGTNSAASLLQAGRCFEQLGRTRQASICYDHLLSRFGESQYAAEASQRLASLEKIIR